MTLVLAALATIGLIFLVVSPCVQADMAKGSFVWYRLDGTWLRNSVVEEEAGNPPRSMIVITPKNLLGTKAAFRGSFIDPQTFLPTGTPEFITDFVGEPLTAIDNRLDWRDTALEGVQPYCSPT
jgi:hypothetical protein